MTKQQSSLFCRNSSWSRTWSAVLTKNQVRWEIKLETDRQDLLFDISCMYWFLATNLVEIAIQRAVSTLSPVNIQIFIPAFLNNSNVDLTSSCNLSSTPVNPSNSKSCSKNCATTALIASFLPSNLMLAAWYKFAKSLYVVFPNLFLAMTNVRRPSRAILAVSSSSQSFRCTIFAMTTSAPFCKKVISPVCASRTTIPMRLDSDVKGKMSRMSNFSRDPLGVWSSMRLRSRKTRVRPTEPVQVTMATSSGEEAWYVTDPSSFVTGVTWNAF